MILAYAGLLMGSTNLLVSFPTHTHTHTHTHTPHQNTQEPSPWTSDRQSTFLSSPCPSLLPHLVRPSPETTWGRGRNLISWLERGVSLAGWSQGGQYSHLSISLSFCLPRSCSAFVFFRALARLRSFSWKISYIHTLVNWSVSHHLPRHLEEFVKFE